MNEYDLFAGQTTEGYDVQYVYLDFDGETTTYRNPELDLLLDVEMNDSGMTEEQKAYILSELTGKYGDSGVVFTTEKPTDTAEYSTVFVGKTDDFESYGIHTGLAETNDKGNLIRNDNAFVLADRGTDLDFVIDVIDHELGHILAGEEHDHATGDIYDYAYSYSHGKVSSFYETASVTFYDKEDNHKFSVPVSGYYTLNFSASDNHMTCRLSGTSNAGLNFVFEGKEYLNGNPLILSKGSNRVYLYAGENYYMKVERTGSYWPSNYKEYSYTVFMSKSSGSTPSPDPDDPTPDQPVTRYPDLVITSLSIKSPASDYPDKAGMPDYPKRLSFTVKNNGNAAASSSYAYIYDNGSLLASVAVKSLAAGESATYDYTPASFAGSHSFYVIADGGNSVTESNENNNKSETVTYSNSPVVTTRSPDLVFTSCAFSSSSLTTEDTLELIFTIENNGKESASTSYVYIYNGNTYWDEVSIESLSGYDSVTKTYTFQAGDLDVGTYDFHLEADATNKVAERDETNNRSETLRVDVKKSDIVAADLFIDDFFAWDNGLLEKGKTTLDISVKNRGSVTAAGSYVYIYSNDKIIDRIYIDPLRAGESAFKRYTLSSKLLSSGTNELYVVADGSRSIYETNEDNNISISRNIYVVDTTPPKMKKIYAKQDDETTVTVSWDPAADSGRIKEYEVTCGYETVKVDGDQLSYTFEVNGTTAPVISVIAIDEAGLESKAKKMKFKMEDMIKPDQVTGIGLDELTDKYNATFFWDKVYDNSGKPVKYQISLDNGAKYIKSSRQSVKLSKLSAGTHTIRIRAVDKTGNEGEWSETYFFTVYDKTPPKKVAAKAKVYNNDVELYWDTPADNVGVTGYILRYGDAADKFQISWEEEWLSADTGSRMLTDLDKGKYAYEMIAYDAEYNYSKVKKGKFTVKTDLVSSFADTPDLNAWQETGFAGCATDDLLQNSRSQNTGFTALA